MLLNGMCIKERVCDYMYWQQDVLFLISVYTYILSCTSCKGFSRETFFPCCQRQLWGGGLYTSNLHIWTQAGWSYLLLAGIGVTPMQLTSERCVRHTSSFCHEQPPSKAQAGDQAAVWRGGKHSLLYPQPWQLNIEHRRSLRWYR